MESYSQLYTRKIVDSIIHGLERRHSSILFVKHYNTLNVPIEAIQEAVEKSNDKIELLYHEFAANKMQEAYEPFLGWVKQLYFKFYYDVPLDDFLENADVYYLSRSTIKSYITTGECERTEEIIVNEVDYKRKQFVNSLVNILSYISREHTLFLVLNRLHLAENSTLNFLYRFITKSYTNISLLANYNEAYVAPAYTQEIWAEFEVMTAMVQPWGRSFCVCPRNNVTRSPEYGPYCEVKSTCFSSHPFGRCQCVRMREKTRFRGNGVSWPRLYS